MSLPRFPRVAAIGVDLVKVLRIASILESPREARFLQRVLHESELAKLRLLPRSGAPEFVAGCWAAKEAVFKTLLQKQQKQFQFRNWLRSSHNGKPHISSTPPLPDSDFLLSISHDDGLLIATVLRQEYVPLI